MCLDQAVSAAVTKTAEGLVKQSFSEFRPNFYNFGPRTPRLGRDAQIYRFPTAPKAGLQAPVA